MLRNWAPTEESQKELRATWKGPDKSLRRRSGFWVGLRGKRRQDPGPVPTHRGPGSWWAAGARPCVVHYHTQRAGSTTPPSIGRRMPPCWLPHNLVRKAPGTKAPAPSGEGHWKGRRSMPVWVCSSSAVDNGCWQVLGEDRQEDRVWERRRMGFERGGGWWG